MFKVLALAFTLASVFCFVVNSQSQIEQTPAPSQTATLYKPKTATDRKMLEYFSRAPEPCRAVSFVEVVSPLAHMAWFLGTERFRATSEYYAAIDSLDLRKASMMKLREKIAAFPASTKQPAAPALKALDSVVNSFSSSADRDTEKFKPVKKNKIVAARRAALVSLRERLRAQISTAYASPVQDNSLALKVLDVELISIEQERGNLSAETAKKCAGINTSLADPGMH
jgi:hypothetical protein